MILHNFTQKIQFWLVGVESFSFMVLRDIFYECTLLSKIFGKHFLSVEFLQNMFIGRGNSSASTEQELVEA